MANRIEQLLPQLPVFGPLLAPLVQVEPQKATPASTFEPDAGKGGVPPRRSVAEVALSLDNSDPSLIPGAGTGAGGQSAAFVESVLEQAGYPLPGSAADAPGLFAQLSAMEGVQKVQPSELAVGDVVRVRSGNPPVERAMVVVGMEGGKPILMGPAEAGSPARVAKAPFDGEVLEALRLPPSPTEPAVDPELPAVDPAAGGDDGSDGGGGGDYGSDSGGSGSGGGGDYGGGAVAGADGAGATDSGGGLDDWLFDQVLGGLLGLFQDQAQQLEGDADFLEWCKKSGKDPKSKDAKVSYLKAKLKTLGQDFLAKFDLKALAAKLTLGGEAVKAEVEGLFKELLSAKVDVSAMFDLGRKVMEVAQSVLGVNAGSAKLSGPLAKFMEDWVPNNVNCANYVSAVLEAAGLITHKQYSANVLGLANNLRRVGWKSVSIRDAKPGDVVCLKTSSRYGHVVIFAGWKDGKPLYIGSNNINRDGSQRISWTQMSYDVTEVLTPGRA